jgi:HD-like signal output (HDOD) protein
MLRSLLSWFGIGTRRTPAAGPARKPSPVDHPEPEEVPSPQADAIGLSPDAVHFLESLVNPPSTSDLQDLPSDDRLFLSEILKKLQDNSLEVPVLPNTALEVSRLMADPKSNLGDFVEAIETDPSLSVSVLRTANSAFYGLSVPTTSLRDAVFRIGLGQLRTIVILSHLQGKVLQSGMFEQEVHWLSDLSLALAHLGQTLSPELGLERSVAFTRGTLWHLEHFLIMGTLVEVARQRRVSAHPSDQCLHEAFFRFGRKIRELAARIWELEDLLIPQAKEGEAIARYGHLQLALIAAWTGNAPPQEVDWVSRQRLTEALALVSCPGDSIT